MFSPIPPSPSPTPKAQVLSNLKEKTAGIENLMKAAAAETDTLIKATLYSISKNDVADASQELEKLRRINKAQQQKMLFHIQELNKAIKKEDDAMNDLLKDKEKLQLKVEEAQQNLAEVLQYEKAGSDDDLFE